METEGDFDCARGFSGPKGDLMKKRIELEDKAELIRKGEDFLKYSRTDILSLQDFALDIKDLELYDLLESYWKVKKFR